MRYHYHNNPWKSADESSRRVAATAADIAALWASARPLFRAEAVHILEKWQGKRSDK